jgi:hypothetical protein
LKVKSTSSNSRLCSRDNITHEVIVSQTNPKQEYSKRLNRYSYTASFDQVIPYRMTTIKVISYAADNQTSSSRSPSSLSPEIGQFYLNGTTKLIKKNFLLFYVQIKEKFKAMVYFGARAHTSTVELLFLLLTTDERRVTIFFVLRTH